MHWRIVTYLVFIRAWYSLRIYYFKFVYHNIVYKYIFLISFDISTHRVTYIYINFFENISNKKEVYARVMAIRGKGSLDTC